MFVRVYKKDGQWFRCDNDSIVGRDIPPSLFREMYNNNILAENEEKIIKIREGYYDKEHHLVVFCNNRDNCNRCSKEHRYIFCKNVPNVYKTSRGYYISIDD